MDDRYTAVVFTSQRRRTPAADTDGYAEMAVRMEELARRQPGFRGLESVRNTDGLGITVAYFDSDQHARDWKQHPEHLEAQRLGRDRWYEWYELRVASVEREYGWRREPGVLHHIALPADWEAARAAGEYTVSTRGRSLREEGFIHCSFERQVDTTANAFYGDLDELVLLRIDPALIGSEVVVEPPYPGAPDDFPHVYGAVPVTAVVSATPWRRPPDGAWSILDAEPGQGPLKTASPDVPSRPA